MTKKDEMQMPDTRLAKTAVNQKSGSTVASNEAMPPTAPDEQFTCTHSRAMLMCICGSTFAASGAPKKVQRKLDKWRAEHADCKPRLREPLKTFWMSFCDVERPKGRQFLGACVIDVSDVEAEDAAIDVLLRFPFAQPDSEWIAAATMKAHRLGCNPGGQVATKELPQGHPALSFYKRGVLMDKATIERINDDIKRADASE